MKKILKMTIVWSFALSLMMPSMALAKDSPDAPTWDDDMYEHECVKDVDLTKEQQQKLDELYDKLYEDKKGIMEALAEYGVITPEQKEKHVKWMKAHIKKAKKHPGFMCDDDYWEDDDRYENEGWDD